MDWVIFILPASSCCVRLAFCLSVRIATPTRTRISSSATSSSQLGIWFLYRRSIISTASVIFFFGMLALLEKSQFLLLA